MTLCSVRLLFLTLAIAGNNNVWINNFRMLSIEFEINIFQTEYSGENIHFSFLQRSASFQHSWSAWWYLSESKSLVLQPSHYSASCWPREKKGVLWHLILEARHSIDAWCFPPIQPPPWVCPMIQKLAINQEGKTIWCLFIWDIDGEKSMGHRDQRVELQMKTIITSKFQLQPFGQLVKCFFFKKKNRNNFFMATFL